MRVPLIGAKDANTAENRVYPALDGAARIVFDEADGVPSVYKARAIKSMDMLTTGKSEFPFWLEGIYNNWEVFVTDRRIAVRNPYTMALFRKPKEKAGKVSVGHIPYGAMCNLAAIFGNNTPVLICACMRRDGTKSSFAIEGSDIESLKKLATDLYNRIDNYIVANNLKIVVDDNTKDTLRKAVSNWSTFLERAWTTQDVTVFVPCNSWNNIPDNNL